MKGRAGRRGGVGRRREPAERVGGLNLEEAGRELCPAEERVGPASHMKEVEVYFLKHLGWLPGRGEFTCSV